MQSRLNAIYVIKYQKSLHKGLYEATSKQYTADIISLYTLRNEVFRSKKGYDNTQFVQLVNDLIVFPFTELLPYACKTTGFMHVVYTDLNTTIVAGELFTAF